MAQADDGVDRNNAHILVFDAHGEYGTAFPDANDLLSSVLLLPYWLMTAEELESLFVESSELNSHNQVSQFRFAVTRCRQRANPEVPSSSILFDTPIPFVMTEVLNYLDNVNREVVSKLPGDYLKPKLADGGLIERADDRYFTSLLEFAETSTARDSKASPGPFNGEFDRFVIRIENRLADKRLAFLMSTGSADDGDSRPAQKISILKALIGYTIGSERPITRVDLGDVPYDVVPLVVGLVSRLVFEMNVMRKRTDGAAEVPFLLVLEEAHAYVARNDSRHAASARSSIERIAKEGRKYGTLLMIVSQRPGEISETILAQCSNFVVMRLTNPSDQTYVRRLLPDNLGGWMDGIGVLPQRHAIFVGDAISAPAVVLIDLVQNRPSSSDVMVIDEWKKRWVDISPALLRD